MTEHLTMQQIVDRVYDHFVTQRKPFAFDSDGHCHYRVPGSGARCAIGIFMEGDEVPHHNTAVDCVELARYAPCLESVDSQFLLDIQGCHDSADLYSLCIPNMRFFLSQMTDVCRKYGLIMPGSDQAAQQKPQ